LGSTLAFHVSNIGRLNIQNNYKSFSLDNLFMAPGTSTGNSLPIIVTTFENQLTIITHALEDLYSSEMVQKLIQGTVELMNVTSKLESV